jgi:hypothetical protein
MWPTAEPIVIVADAPPPLSSRAPASFAPNTPAGTWPAAASPVAFALALPQSRDLGGQAGAELDVALRTWTRPSCTAWRARYDGERAAVAADDGVNVVLFHDDAWPAELVQGAVAQTVVHTDVAGRYRDADIHVNGVDFRFSLDGAPGTLDLRSILVHELGHALGLGHASDARATMFATGSGLRWRSLEKDDIDGVCSLYPGTGAAGCELSPCPAPFLCVAGACQRPGEPRDVCSPCERVTGACEAAGDDARCIDLGEGASAGRVCGRSCVADTDCGAGFACLTTTEAGDRQCVSRAGCTNGANVCTTDTPCKSGTCRGGACMGPPGLADAGADAGSLGDAGSGGTGDGDSGERPEPGGGGCACGLIEARAPLAPRGKTLLALSVGLALFVSLRRRRAE